MDIKKTGNAALRHDKVINESPANLASPVISFRVYVAGGTTAGYQASVTQPQWGNFFFYCYL